MKSSVQPPVQALSVVPVIRKNKNKNRPIERVDTRDRLEPSNEPYWKELERGRHIGFRLLTKKSIGAWYARYFDGKKYQRKSLGQFADVSEKERYAVAKKATEAWFDHLGRGGSAKPGTVKEACIAYDAHLRAEKRDAAADDAQSRYWRLIYAKSTSTEPEQKRRYSRKGAKWKHKRLTKDDPIARITLDKATKADFDAFRQRLRKKLGDATFNRSISSIRAALNRAKEIGKVASDLAWKSALLPVKGAGERRDLYLPREERTALIAGATLEAQRFLTVLNQLPLRVGDVAKFRVEHFDSRHAALRVSKGKTESREIPLGKEAVAHLRQCAKGKTKGAWLVSRDDAGQWKKEAWRSAVKAAAKKAGLPSGVVAYTLRHSLITDLVTDGLDIFTIAKLSGTSVAMIEKHYGHLQRDHAREALDRLAIGA